jgi:hypothetical protein
MTHCWRITCAAGILGVLCWVATAAAEDDKGKGKSKAKDEPKKSIVEIDLSKLPPDLVKQLLKYADTRKTPKTEEKKGPKSDDFGAVVQKLKAKGLRGRDLAEAIHKAKGMKGKGKKDEPKKGAPGKKKKKGEEDDD